MRAHELLHVPDGKKKGSGRKLFILTKKASRMIRKARVLAAIFERVGKR